MHTHACMLTQNRVGRYTQSTIVLEYAWNAYHIYKELDMPHNFQSPQSHSGTATQSLKPSTVRLDS